MWKEYDNYFFDNLDIVDKYILITTLDGKHIGHISWNPRNKPDYVEIGHNCILTKYKGKGETIRRIKEYKDLKKIIVTTNEITLPAKKIMKVLAL